MRSNVFELRAWKWFLFKRAIWLLVPILYLMNLYATDWLEFTKLILTLFFAFFSGVTLNDYFHRKDDLKADKNNGIEKKDKGTVFAIIITIVLSTALAYKLSGFYAIFFPLALAFEGIYSAYLKNKGIAGAITNTLAELLPFLFIFAFFGHWQTDTVVLTVLYFIISLTDIINHQLEDIENDRKAGVNTVPIKHGEKKTSKALDTLSLIGTYLFFVLVFFFLKLPYFPYLLLGLLLLRLFHPIFNPEIKKSFNVRLSYVDFVLIGLLNIIPIYFALLLINESWTYLPVLAFVLITDYNFLRQIGKRVKLSVQ